MNTFWAVRYKHLTQFNPKCVQMMLNNLFIKQYQLIDNLNVWGPSYLGLTRSI